MSKHSSQEGEGLSALIIFCGAFQRRTLARFLTDIVDAKVACTTFSRVGL